MQLATLVALLIELKAQFYKLVTINQCLVAYTCEMVNKSGKSILCYIDSDSIVIVLHAFTAFVPGLFACSLHILKWYAADTAYHFFVYSSRQTI